MSKQEEKEMECASSEDTETQEIDDTSEEVSIANEKSFGVTSDSALSDLLSVLTSTLNAVRQSVII